MKLKRLRKPLKPFRTTATTVCIGGVLLGNAGVALADGTADEELKARVAQLEAMMAKEGILPSGVPAPKFVHAMSDITISGFVQASYFYNTDHPSDGVSDAYLWNASNNSFSINKVKVTLASKPVESSGSDWSSAFRVSLIWGEDARNLNTGIGNVAGNSFTGVQPPGGMPITNIVTSPFSAQSSASAGFEALREAYVEMNVPIGTGLNVRAGQLISLLNWESGDGGAANPNFSQGNQWWFTGNGPSAGIQLGYSFSDAVSLKVRVQNGMFAGPVDFNNDGKAVVASLGIKPCSKSWVNLIGWFSESEFPGTDVSGGSVIGGYQATAKLGTGFEFDYFHFDAAADFDVWSLGGWVWYDFTSKVAIALRADYVDSPDVPLGPAPRPSGGISGTDSDGNLGSVTLTLNYKPTPNVKIQPEIRYDYTSFSGGLDGSNCRFIVGAGISYLF